MIISHKLRIIYIRLQKVASTSFEMALSKYCVSGDIMAKLGMADDEIRESLGYYDGDKKRKQRFKPHISANLIREKISADIWNNYLKIAIIRNPYERMISKYYYRFSSDKERSTKNFYRYLKAKRDIAGFLYDTIHIEGKLVLDYCIRYEHLAEDIKALEVKINCPGLYETMQNFSFKKEFRPKEKASMYEMYTKYPEAKSVIDEDLYESWDKYELLREHWPKYKSELEEILAAIPTSNPSSL